MRKATLLLSCLGFAFAASAQPATQNKPLKTSFRPVYEKAMVDINAYDSLIHEVEAYRSERLLSLDSFLAVSKRKKVVILDTRSDSMYKAKHVKGAIHLSFPDFIQQNLAALIPSPDTKILIYCNNNFDEGYSLAELNSSMFIPQTYFATKVAMPSIDLYQPVDGSISSKKTSQKQVAAAGKKTAGQDANPGKKQPQKLLTLALNIPTFINLYGYGYKNVYELAELVSVNDPRIEFEGTAVLPGAVKVMTLGKPGKLIADPSGKVTASPFVNYHDYDSLTHVVIKIRQQRLLGLDSFLVKSRNEDVVILDTRSDAMYKAKHVKGAIHLSFSNFTQANLDQLIPSKDTKILIYCNNNFINDPNRFASKMYFPPTRLDGSRREEKAITLALNIPTYINLHGYGFKNIYELDELVDVDDPRIEFEGTDIGK